MSAFEDDIDRQIAVWFSISPPNVQAHRFAAELPDIIAAFQQQHGKIRIEDEPSSFELALQATKETEETEE